MLCTQNYVAASGSGSRRKIPGPDQECVSPSLKGGSEKGDPTIKLWLVMFKSLKVIFVHDPPFVFFLIFQYSYLIVVASMLPLRWHSFGIMFHHFSASFVLNALFIHVDRKRRPGTKFATMCIALFWLKAREKT